MDPAKPPLPTDSYRPDQFDSGSHTSNLISESWVGRISPATRQKAAGIGFGCMNARAHDGTGGVKPPAATDSARVMVVLGNAMCAKSAQLPAATAAAVAAAGSAAHASHVNDANANTKFEFLPVIAPSPFQNNQPASLQDTVVALHHRGNAQACQNPAPVSREAVS